MGNLENVIKSINLVGAEVVFEFKEDVRLPKVSSIVPNLLFDYFSTFSTAYYHNFQRIKLKRGGRDYVVKGYDPDKKVHKKKISE